MNLSVLQEPPAIVKTVEEVHINGFLKYAKLKQAAVNSIIFLGGEQQLRTWQDFVIYTKSWQKQMAVLELYAG